MIRVMRIILYTAGIDSVERFVSQCAYRQHKAKDAYCKHQAGPSSDVPSGRLFHVKMSSLSLLVSENVSGVKVLKFAGILTFLCERFICVQRTSLHICLHKSTKSYFVYCIFAVFCLFVRSSSHNFCQVKSLDITR